MQRFIKVNKKLINQRLQPSKNTIQLSNNGNNPISKGNVYKAVFRNPADITINIPGTTRSYHIKEYSLHFLDPNSAINSHIHSNDSEIYFKPNFSNNSWTSIGFCSNGESHSAERSEYLNDKDSSINGILAGVKLVEEVKDENKTDRQIIENYLKYKVLPSIYYSPDYNRYGFKSKDPTPQICIAKVTSKGLFKSFAITSHSNTMHIVKPSFRRGRIKLNKHKPLRGTVTDTSISETFDNYFSIIDQSDER